jgi:hypothetical protein
VEKIINNLNKPQVVEKKLSLIESLLESIDPDKFKDINRHEYSTLFVRSPFKNFVDFNRKLREGVMFLQLNHSFYKLWGKEEVVNLTVTSLFVDAGVYLDEFEQLNLFKLKALEFTRLYEKNQITVSTKVSEHNNYVLGSFVGKLRDFVSDLVTIQEKLILV